MGEIVGYLGGCVLIAFLIVKFGLNKSFEKKNGRSMEKGELIAKTICVGIIVFIVCMLGRIS